MAHSNLTPTAAAHVINALIEARGLARKPVTSQMMYGYAKKGALAKHVVGTKPLTIDGEGFALWMETFLTGGGARRIDVDALVAEYL